MTTLADFRRRVFLNVRRHDGEVNLAFEQAINDAHKAIARAVDFDEMMVVDTANAATVANQQRYHIANDWGLHNPKDIHSIRYMANSESRKLVYVPPREFDRCFPYPESATYGKPQYYTQKGMYAELLRIPDANANLYIYHSMWPDDLSNETDETPYSNIDDVITQLATEMTQAYLSGGGVTDWTKRALTLLGQVVTDQKYKPDQALIARPFEMVRPRYLNEYWNDPWVKRSPN